MQWCFKIQVTLPSKQFFHTNWQPWSLTTQRYHIIPTSLYYWLTSLRSGNQMSDIFDRDQRNIQFGPGKHNQRKAIFCTFLKGSVDVLFVIHYCLHKNVIYRTFLNYRNERIITDQAVKTSFFIVHGWTLCVFLSHTDRFLSHGWGGYAPQRKASMLTCSCNCCTQSLWAWVFLWTWGPGLPASECYLRKHNETLPEAPLSSM